MIYNFSNLDDLLFDKLTTRQFKVYKLIGRKTKKDMAIKFEVHLATIYRDYHQIHDSISKLLEEEL